MSWLMMDRARQGKGVIGRERLRGEGVTVQIRCYVKGGGDSAMRGTVQKGGGASGMEEGV